MRHLVWLLLGLGACKLAASNTVPDAATVVGAFANPTKVSILGWTDHAMEPFLSRDGHTLYFNNSNDAAVNTDLHAADRIDDLTYRYRGPVSQVNTPTALEGVASDDDAGNFYFISTRSYAGTLSTIWRLPPGAAGPALVPGVAASQPGHVIFDVVVSPDGGTLAFAEGVFTANGGPTSAELVLATRAGTDFARSPSSASLLQGVNLAGAVQYAPVFSASLLELYFTRVGPSGPVIYGASRASLDAPFSAPLALAAITGFAETPTLSRDEKSLYYHLKDQGTFAIYRVTRP